MQTFQHSARHTAGNYRHRVPSTNLAVALAYARTGIPVFPCDARKRPLIPNGFHGATTDLDTIRRWWVRWPDALVGIPTGPGSGVWVSDIDGEPGRRSLSALMVRLDIETLVDVSPCISLTPGGGLHLIFRLELGERPRNRVRDIGDGVDTRGVKTDGSTAGYFIAPGSMLSDGRRYTLVDALTMQPIEPPEHPFENAATAPRGLLYLASFSAAERAVIAASPELRDAIRDGATAEWPAIVERHQAAQRQTVAMTRPIRQRADGDCADEQQHRYAAAILDRELRALANMQRGSGRNHAAFKLACRVGRWVHHNVIRSDDFTAAVLDACELNGLVQEDGRAAVLATIASGLARATNDTLPTLEVRA